MLSEKCKIVSVFASYSNNSNKSAISVWAKWMMSAKWLDTRNEQNKNKTPPPSIGHFHSQNRPHVSASMSMSEYANFLRHYGLELFDSFPCDFIVLALSTNTIHILRIILSKAIHQARKWTHSCSIWNECVYLWCGPCILKWIETKFRNSLCSGRNHHLIAPHSQRN